MKWHCTHELKLMHCTSPTALYDKQIDNLRTNHRGVYVLVDHSFKPLNRVSWASGKGNEEEEEEIRRQAKFVSWLGFHHRLEGVSIFNPGSHNDHRYWRLKIVEWGVVGGPF